MGTCASSETEVTALTPIAGRIPSLSRPLGQQLHILHSLARTDPVWMFETELLMQTWQAKYWGSAWEEDLLSPTKISTPDVLAASGSRHNKSFRGGSGAAAGSSLRIGQSFRLPQLNGTTPTPTPPAGTTNSSLNSSTSMLFQQQQNANIATLQVLSDKKEKLVKAGFYLSFPPKLSARETAQQLEDSQRVEQSAVFTKSGDSKTAAEKKQKAVWCEATDGSWFIPTACTQNMTQWQRDEAVEELHEILSVVAACFVGNELRCHVTLPKALCGVARSDGSSLSPAAAAGSGATTPGGGGGANNNNGVAVMATRTTHAVFTNAYHQRSDDGKVAEEPSPLSLRVKFFTARLRDAMSRRHKEDVCEEDPPIPNPLATTHHQKRNNNNVVLSSDNNNNNNKEKLSKKKSVTAAAAVAASPKSSAPPSTATKDEANSSAAKYIVATKEEPNKKKASDNKEDDAAKTSEETKKINTLKKGEGGDAQRRHEDNDGGEEADHNDDNKSKNNKNNNNKRTKAEEEKEEYSDADDDEVTQSRSNDPYESTESKEESEEVVVNDTRPAWMLAEAQRRGSLYYEGRVGLDEPDLRSVKIQRLMDNVRQWVDLAIVESFVLVETSRAQLPQFNAVLLNTSPSQSEEETSRGTPEDSSKRTTTTTNNKTKGDEVPNLIALHPVYQALHVSRAVAWLLARVDPQRQVEQIVRSPSRRYQLFAAQRNGSGFYSSGESAEETAAMSRSSSLVLGGAAVPPQRAKSSKALVAGGSSVEATQKTVLTEAALERFCKEQKTA